MATLCTNKMVRTPKANARVAFFVNFVLLKSLKELRMHFINHDHTLGKLFPVSTSMLSSG